jgi:predicted transcriptional regulator of viral defense system
MQMTKDVQTITRRALGRSESRFLSSVGRLPSFSLADGRRVLGKRQGEYVRQFVDRLEEKGWVQRIKPGRFAVIPLSSTTGHAHVHEFLLAMELVQPAAVAYFSALNHHGFTEQLPRTVFVATDHRVAKPERHALGVTFRIVTLRKPRFFGLTKAWIDERPFMVTDREKTIIDALDLPRLAGGIGIVSEALRSSWLQLDEKRLRDYAIRIGNSAVAKRLGFLMEAHSVGDAEALRKAARLAHGYPALDPTVPAGGTYNRRWGLLVNAKVTG